MCGILSAGTAPFGACKSSKAEPLYPHELHNKLLQFLRQPPFPASPQRNASAASARRELRSWIRLQVQVPVRQDRHADEAGTGELSGHGNCLLLILPNHSLRRNGLWTLGNVSGQPYILQTNIFAAGTGEREQRIFLWFDPTAAFHEYSVLWNRHQIVFYVDRTPIRVFRNLKTTLGMEYPDSQPVGIYSTIWNGQNWATNDGWVKLNWSCAPFAATYETFHVDACLALNGISRHCIAARNDWWEHLRYHRLSAWGVRRLQWVRRKFLVYNYCTDTGRNPTPPAECAWNVL